MLAPAAVLYHFTPISFRVANRIVILWFLALAHVTVFLLFRGAMVGRDGTPPTRPFFVLTAYSIMMFWTLQGFYDAVALAPLFLAASLIERRRGHAALAAYSVSTVLHFRAFLLAPWSIWAAWLALRKRPWRCKEWATASVTIALTTSSLATFAMVWWPMSHLPRKNGIDAPWKLVVSLLLVAGCSAIFVRARAWLDLLTLVCFALMISAAGSLYPWRCQIFLPWLLAPFGGRPERATSVAVARYTAALVWSLIAFGTLLVPGFAFGFGF
ncbi:MAG: hypothetical protein JXP73_12295 [Deltaproteobacteria bacterium]|nr:hypothetical protein [Deltaproteobacteria bacterium]